MLSRKSGLILVAALLAHLIPSSADAVSVHFREGTQHGFLSLRSEAGKIIASGNLVETVRGNEVHTRLTFRFRDGSLDDESAVYTQNGQFRLLRDHHIQRGPSFKEASDLTIDTPTGQVTARYLDHGEAKVETKHMDLPSDLANGFLLTALKNIQSDTKETRLPFLIAGPKPRLIHFVITPEAFEPFYVAGLSQKSVRFNLKVEIGGVAGVVAPLIGKQPPDGKIWVALEGAPAFVKSETPLFLGGPIWRIEMVSPVYSKSSLNSDR